MDLGGRETFHVLALSQDGLSVRMPVEQELVELAGGERRVLAELLEDPGDDLRFQLSDLGGVEARLGDDVGEQLQEVVELRGQDGAPQYEGFCPGFHLQ